MKVFSRSAQSQPALAQTQIYNLLDDQLLVCLRPWGSSDYNQKFLDEITHYLSSTQADLEVTTPFDYQENLSNLANRTRVALLLAHDLFFKTENKSEYSVGFEALILFISRQELAWSAVGRFAVDKISEPHTVTPILQNGSDLDSETLLPVQLIGVEREIDISSGSLRFIPGSRVVISSVYQNELVIRPERQTESLVDVGSDGSYWFTVLSPG